MLPLTLLLVISLHRSSAVAAISIWKESLSSQHYWLWLRPQSPIYNFESELSWEGSSSVRYFPWLTTIECLIYSLIGRHWWAELAIGWIILVSAMEYIQLQSNSRIVARTHEGGGVPYRQPAVRGWRSMSQGLVWVAPCQDPLPSQAVLVWLGWPPSPPRCVPPFFAWAPPFSCPKWFCLVAQLQLPSDTGTLQTDTGTITERPILARSLLFYSN